MNTTLLFALLSLLRTSDKYKPLRMDTLLKSHLKKWGAGIDVHKFLDLFSISLKETYQLLQLPANSLWSGNYLGTLLWCVNRRTYTEKQFSHLLSVDGIVLRHGTPQLKNTKSFVSIAVAQNGKALEFASDALRADREVVLTAVAQNGSALKFASDALQNDLKVVLSAVKQNVSAICYCSMSLKNNKEVALAAVVKSPEIYHQLGNNIKMDVDVLKEFRGNK